MSSVRFPKSVMIWAAMSSAGVGPLCFLKSIVNAAIYQDILEHFMLHSADKLWRCWFHFPAGLGTCPHCQRYQKLVQWPWCYCAWLASKLAWPEPHRESMEYCQEEDERHQTQTSVAYIEINILSRSLGFLFKISFFLLIMCNFQIFWDIYFWDTEFCFCIICKP